MPLLAPVTIAVLPVRSKGDAIRRTWKRLAALGNELLQLRDRVARLRRIEGHRDLLVEARNAGIHVARSPVVLLKLRDLLHLGDPAIGLGRHAREAALS